MNYKRKTYSITIHFYTYSPINSMALSAERMRELAKKKSSDANPDDEKQKEIDAANLKEQQDAIAEQERIKAENEKNDKEKKSSKKDKDESKKPTREEILAALSEELGEEVKDISEIKARFAKPLDTEELKTLQAREFADKIKFAVDNKIATPEQILEWQKIQDEDEETLTFSEFAKDAKKKNPKISDEELKSDYATYYFQNQIDDENDDEETKKRKQKWNQIGTDTKKSVAEQKKTQAKKNLEKVDTQYSFHKEYVRKAQELTSSIQDVLKDYSNTFSIAVTDPENEESIDMQIELENVPKLVENFLAENNRFNNIIQSGKQADKKFIRELADTYIKTLPQYQAERDKALIAKFKSIGLTNARIGTTKEIPPKQGEGTGEKQRDAKVEKMANLMKEKSK